jgi:hypothetical protein
MTVGLTLELDCLVHDHINIDICISFSGKIIHLSRCLSCMAWVQSCMKNIVLVFLFLPFSSFAIIDMFIGVDTRL